VSLYLPLLVPAGFGFLGSFGGITRFRGFVPDRAALLDVAEAGPAVGVVVSSALLLLGLGLSAAGLGDVTVDSAAFADSWSVGLLTQAMLGDALTNPEVRVSSLVVAGWAGLVVNALNCLPAGELDGGRISLALFGRRCVGLGPGARGGGLMGAWGLFQVRVCRGLQSVKPAAKRSVHPPHNASHHQHTYTPHPQGLHRAGSADHRVAGDHLLQQHPRVLLHPAAAGAAARTRAALPAGDRPPNRRGAEAAGAGPAGCAAAGAAAAAGGSDLGVP